MSKEEKIQKLNNKIAQCTKCDLREGCIQPVPGGGNLDANIFFVGEGSGKEEDEQKKVFCGRSGKLLNTWIKKELFMRREDVFIANISKCRPPNNRNPKPAEVESCIPYLKAQIDIVQPKVIVLLGAVALKALFKNDKLGIMRCRGEWREYNGMPVMPTYHPAFLLRQMSERNKNAVKYDLSLVLEQFKK